MNMPAERELAPEMTGAKRSVRQATAPQLICLLEGVLQRFDPAQRPLIAFDADGTLWRCDVGELLFEAALRHCCIRDEALPALQELAAQYRIDALGTPTTLAARLYQAYCARTIPERVGAHMLIWCYAGWSTVEWYEFAGEAIANQHLAERLNPSAVQILRWAQRRGLIVKVISASPHAAVAAAAARLDVPSTDVIAGAPRTIGQRFVPELAAPLPWGEHKAHAGRHAARGASWLAALGDSAFDAAMLRAAHYPIAVCPRPELRAQLDELHGCQGAAAVELIAGDAAAEIR